MKKKFKITRKGVFCEEEIESFSHMEFYAYIIIDDRIVNYECVSLQNQDERKFSILCKSLETKYNNMYQDLLRYREKYDLETMNISLEFRTTHNTNNLPI